MAKIINRKQYGKKCKYIPLLQTSEWPHARLWVTIYLKCNANDVLWVCATSTATSNVGNCIENMAGDLKKRLK